MLENVQRRWTKQIEGLSSLSYADRLKTLELYSVQGRLWRADMIQCWKLFNGKSCLSPTEFLDVCTHSRTRGHCHKITVPTTNSDIRMRSFSVRCVKPWNSLPAEAVCAPDLTSFKAMLDRCMRDKLYGIS